MGKLKQNNRSELKTFFTEMYEGVDFMQYNEHIMNKYVNKLMTVLYTPKELQEGLIIEGEATTSVRRRLYLEKFNLIKIKFIFNFKTFLSLLINF